MLLLAVTLIRRFKRAMDFYNFDALDPEGSFPNLHPGLLCSGSPGDAHCMGPHFEYEICWVEDGNCQLRTLRRLEVLKWRLLGSCHKVYAKPWVHISHWKGSQDNAIRSIRDY